DALDDGAAGVLGRGGRRQDAAPGAGLRQAPARVHAERAPMTARQRAERRTGLVMVAPAVLALALLTVYPALWVLWLSLQERVPIFGISRFVGLRHFAFLAGDARFWSATRVTLVFTAASVALELALGLAVALALQRQRAGRRVALSLLLLAWALPSVVTAKLF